MSDIKKRETVALYSNHYEGFKAYSEIHGLPEVELYKDVDRGHFIDYLFTTIDAPNAPIVVDPSTAEINKLGAGAIVAIHFEHMGSQSRDDYFFLTELKEVSVPKYSYHSYSGVGEGEMLPDAASIKYVPINPEPLIDDIDGYRTCHGSHIKAIYSWGRPKPIRRNFLAEEVETNLRSHIKTKRVMKSIGQKRSMLGNPHPYEGHHAFNYGRTWNNQAPTAYGQYNGNLYELAIAIVARRPSLVITGYLDAVKFNEMYFKAGCPGRVGDYSHGFYKPLTLGPWAKVNTKAFTKWVIRNYPKFTLSVKEMIEMGMENSRQGEIAEYKVYIADMEAEFRYG